MLLAVMLSKEILEAHYAEYGNQPDSWVANMEKTKKSIIERVLTEASFHPATDEIEIAVLGASDKRYLAIHEHIFRELLGKNVSVVTLDCDTKHLGAPPNTIQCDVTQPLPGGPYDIVMSHALMKFLTPPEQFAVIKNSYEALKSSGVAMHIMHPPELEGTTELRDWQYRVNLDDIINKLNEEQIPTKVVTFESDSSVDWLRYTTALILQKK